MSTQEIFDLIVNWPAESEVQEPGHLDAVLDFVCEHVGDRELSRFQDIASILTWLNGDHSNSMIIGQYDITTSDGQQCNDTAKSQVLRPGTKITIRKPSANDIKFNDMESVQAYLNQGPANQSNDDSEEVDVTTFDFSPPWNQYHIVEAPPKSQKNTKLHRVLTEKPPTASATNIGKCPKKTRTKSTDKSLVDPMYNGVSEGKKNEKENLSC